MTEPPPDDPGPGGPEEAEPDRPAPRRDPLGLARDIADAYRGGAPAPQRRHRRRPESPRRRSRDDPAPVADAVGDLVRQQGWDSRLSMQRVFTDWASIVGPDVAQHSHVTGYADGIVHVQTDSTAWAKQLLWLAPQLVAQLNRELGDGSVLRIEVRGPTAPSWKSGGRSIRGARGPRDTYG